MKTTSLTVIYKPSLLLATAILLVACGGGGGSNSNAVAPATPAAATPPAPAPTPAPPPPAPTPPPAAAPATVTISGAVTFEDVPVNTVGNGLDYNAIFDAPARGVIVEALAADGSTMVSTSTDSAGNYSVSVPADTDVQIRVRAQMVQSTGTIWDVRVQDNTAAACVADTLAAGSSSNCPIYVMDGTLTSSGSANSTRNLNAPSGWGGSNYTGPRVAGPFAILSPVYDTLTAFEAVAPGAIFPPADFNWSVDNVSVSGDRADGEIGTSSYIGNGQIFILGEEDVDTDEYDEDVVVHEWGHYFEDQLSRSDSIGGAHGLTDRLDPRLAFSEGLGNALAGIGNNDPVYRDSGGTQQAFGFAFSLEDTISTPNPGWFDESSVQEILFDVVDSNDDDADTISLGLGPIFNAFTSPDYENSPFFTTLFTFMSVLRDQNPGSVPGINALLNNQNISGTGPDGAGETNGGGIASVLPVYKEAIINGPAVTVCSGDVTGASNASSDFNNLDTRDFVTFTRTSLAPVTLTAQRISGDTDVDPDFIIFRNGVGIAQARSAPAQSDTVTTSLGNFTGRFAVDFFDFDNLDETTGATNPRADGTACYSFTVTQ